MIGEALVLFLSLTSWLVLLVISLAVYRIYRVNQKIAAELEVETEGFFDFNLNNPAKSSTIPKSYLKSFIYIVLAFSIIAILFAITALVEGSSELAAYLFGISLFAMAVSGYYITLNSKTTQTFRPEAAKVAQSQLIEEPNAKPAPEKQESTESRIDSQETAVFTYCRYCGNRNESEAAFCRGCGKKIIQ